MNVKPLCSLEVEKQRNELFEKIEDLIFKNVERTAFHWSVIREERMRKDSSCWLRDECHMFNASLRLGT